MKALLQRVNEASVTVANERVASVGCGLLVFVGVEPADGSVQVEKLADKILGLRIFPDADKPMNRSVREVQGELLVVSQFTLAADTRKGRRPGFSTAAPPDVARPLFEALVALLEQSYRNVAQGVFGADMQVALVNDGPVTFWLEV